MITFSERALSDLERIFEFNLDRNPSTALEHVQRIRSAVQVLEAHPEMGRRVDKRSRLRELVISYGKSGNVALYEHSPVEGLVRVVAIRSQREAGYRGD